MVSTRYFKALTLIVILLSSLPIVNVSADEVIVNRRDLIGQLTPITGDTASASLKITFALSSAKISPNAIAQLNELGSALVSNELGGMNVELYGHTDASGGADKNMALSKARAKSVYDYLVNNFDLAGRNIIHNGYGETSPINPIDAYAAENRRVEIVTSRPLNQNSETPITGETQAIN